MPEFYSFAAITDEPPPEIAAAGHDRCINSHQYHFLKAAIGDSRFVAEADTIMSFADESER